MCCIIVIWNKGITSPYDPGRGGSPHNIATTNRIAFVWLLVFAIFQGIVLLTRLWKNAQQQNGVVIRPTSSDNSSEGLENNSEKEQPIEQELISMV